jgi:diguanylate cyclase (GGDEF)-like protein/PAS domain S-box-containing protein
MNDNTTRKKLLSHEQHLHVLVDNAPDMILRYDRCCRLSYANAQLEVALGIPLQDVLGKTPKEIVSDGSNDIYEAAIKRVIAGGKNGESYLTVLDSYGDETHHHMRMTPELDDSGKVINVFVIGRDITERRRMEAALQAKGEEFRTLAENLPDNIVRWDPAGRVLYCNLVNQRNLGKSAIELFGKTITDAFPDGRFAPLAAAIAQVVASGQTVQFARFFIPMANGERQIHDITLVPERDSDGKIVSVLGIGRDMTEHYRLQDNLRHSREMLVDAQQLALLGSWDWNVVSNRVEWSEMAYAIYTPDKRPAEPGFEDFKASLHPDDLERVVAAVQASFEHDKLFDLDHRVVSVSRGVRAVHAQGKVFRDVIGNPIRMVGTVQDITERKRIESELKVKLEQVVELNNQLEINARDLEEQAAEYEAQAVELEASQAQIMQTEAWYRNIVRSAPDGMVVVNENGIIALVNLNIEKMFGYEEGELIGHAMEILLPADVRQGHVALRDGFFASSSMGRPMDQRLTALRACRKDGSEFPVYVSLSRLPNMDGKTGVICAAIRDVTEHKRLEDALAASEQESRTLVNNSPDTISRYNRECRRIYVNPTFGNMVEGGVAALLGKTPTECPGGANAGLYEEKIHAVFQTGENSEFELRWLNKIGSEIYSHVRMTAERDAAGCVVGVLAIGRDISELNEHRKRVHQMAFYDTLTLLPNRALFNDRLHQMLTDASWHAHLAGVMLLDLDRFKIVNDTLGHPAGDELLREAAARLSLCVRGYDTVSRLGGDEFAILLPEIRSGDDLGRVASKIVESFKEPFHLAGKEVFVTASIGISVYPADGRDSADLLKQADSAMYFAKKSGRNTFRFFSKDLSDLANERLLLEGDLRHGFARGELELYFQPKISLGDGLLMGSEALLRWNHPQRGMVPPDKFISIAEDSGLIIDIGEWVLRGACFVASEWNGQGKPHHKVAINLSARQFQSNDLLQTVRKVLEDTHCYPEWIELEITESLLLDEDGDVLETLESFRKMGITIAIDDFGTGYSSLSYLARFPIDTLKIDRSFTSKLTDGGHHSELVKAIISIAKSLNQKVVAEGVETVAQSAILHAYGCHIAQGYLYSKPIPKALFDRLPRSF